MAADLTTGKLLPAIWRYTLPIILTGILQLLFNAADIVVVGRYAGDNSLAAVGSTSSMVNLLVNFFIGLSIGANVLVARYYGGGQKKELSEMVHTAILTAFISGVILVFAGILVAGPALHAMGTPEDVIDKSVLYMRIYFIGMPFTMAYNFGAAILRAIGDAFPLESDAEISVECNPKTIGFAGLKTLHEVGFNRLSIGLQATQNDLLKRIGRVHTFEEFLITYQAARDAGFRNINIDLMHGLPGQTQDMYLDAIRTVAALDPKHISAYALILEEGTPLFDDVQSGRETLPDPDAVADMEDAGMELLESLGFLRYEVSNFAKPGYECRHNLIYWHNEPYLGIGVAAHSSMVEDGFWVRFSNESSIPAYFKKLEKVCDKYNERH